MSLADDIRILREKGFVQVAVPGEDDLYEIRVNLLDDEPAITLDAVELLIAAYIASTIVQYGVSDSNGEICWSFSIHERDDAIQRAKDVGGEVHVREALYTRWKRIQR